MGPVEVLVWNRAAHAWLITAACFLLLPLFACSHAAFAQDSPMRHHHDSSPHSDLAMPMNEPADPAAPAESRAKLQAKILADKKESEFNHHLAGFFVVIAGIFIFFQSELVRRWPALKYVWPACFLLSGLFILIWSDTELWPFGNRQWLEVLRNNPEVLQHKTFAILLLALGVIEWQRICRALTAAWSVWVFPVLAIAGSVILMFHQHQGGMVGEHRMEAMARIQSEHASYTMCGFGIGLSKGFSELNGRLARIFGKVWPLLMVVLGLLLMFYKE